MLRTLLLSAVFMIGAGASATNVSNLMLNIAKKSMFAHPMARFVVGDTANYSLSVSSMTGTMVMKITSVDSSGVMIDQNITLPMESEDVQELINPQTGAVISITVNGQKQTPPDPNDTQITSETLATITVPAGTYKCQDVKFHLKTENTDGEQWVDMDDIPVGGMLKMTTTEQGMAVEADLTSFSNGN